MDHLEFGSSLAPVAAYGFAIDNPFFRGWIRLRALPDVGIMLPLL